MRPLRCFGDRSGGLRVTLHIGFFVHEFPAVSETFVLNQVTGLLDLGCDVHILSLRRPDSPVSHPDVDRYGLMRRVSYNSMPRSRVKRVVAALPILWRGIRSRPRQTLKALNVFRYGRSAFSLELLFWLDRLNETRRSFDVVYCHFGIVGRLAAFLREIGAVDGSLVTVFHGVDVSATLSGRPDHYRHLFRTGDLFLPISARWRARLIKHGCNPNLVDVHHMGVELQRFRFEKPRPRESGDPLRILTVGRQVEKKGIEYGLRAIALARDRGVPIRYTIIGDGPLRGSLEALTDRLGLNRIVTFCGWQDQDTVAEQIHCNDIMLAPSVTDRTGDQEGIPVTLMEAMASGLVVVSTRHSGIPELVTDGHSGLLADERDVEGLADALVRLHDDEELRERIRIAARMAVAEGFDVRKLNVRLAGIFRCLAGNETTDPLLPEPSKIASQAPRSRVAGVSVSGH